MIDLEWVCENRGQIIWQALDPTMWIVDINWGTEA